MNIFNKSSLKLKVFLLFGMITSTTIVGLVISNYGIGNLSSSYQELLNKNAHLTQEMLNLNIDLLLLRRHEKDFLLRGDRKYIEKHTKTFESLSQRIAKLKEFYPEKETELNEIMDNAQAYSNGFGIVVKEIDREGDSKNGIRGEMRSTAHEIEEIIKKNKLNSQLETTLLNMRRREKDFLLRRDDKYLGKAKKDITIFLKLTRNGRKEKLFTNSLTALTSSYLEYFQKLVNSTNTQKDTIQAFRKNIHKVEEVSKHLIELSSKQMNSQKEKNIELAEQTNFMSLLFGVLQVLAVLVSILVLRKLIVNLTSSTQVLDRTVSSFKTMSGKISQSSTDLSNLTTEQASSIQETATSITEISSMVEKTTQSTVTSRELSEDNAKRANQGKDTVQNLLSSIDSISESTDMLTNSIERNSDELQEIVEIIYRINEKTKIINDIVFQTKLLSFNASVEAARAGEHGKGFSVVAEEISNLADVSGKSAKEITDILNESTSKVESLVEKNKTEMTEMVEINKGKVKQGKDAAQECDLVLHEIMENARKITLRITEVSEASIEQSSGVNQISQAINELSSANQEVASMSIMTNDLSTQIGEGSKSISVVLSELQGIIFGEKQKNPKKQVTKKIDKPKPAPKRPEVKKIEPAPPAPVTKVEKVEENDDDLWEDLDDIA